MKNPPEGSWAEIYNKKHTLRQDEQAIIVRGSSFAAHPIHFKVYDPNGSNWDNKHLYVA